MNRYLKEPLLDVLFDNSSTYGTWKLPVQMIGGAVLILVAGVVIDMIRAKSIDKLPEKCNRILNYYSKRRKMRQFKHL